MRLVQDKSGATAIEYAMIAAGIAVMIATVVSTLGQDVKTNFFDKIAAAVTG
jgi:pilus assembly protein Flp/PilA